MLADSPLPSYRRFSLLAPAFFSTALTVASPQTSFGEKWMRDKRTPKDVCGEATLTEDMAQATFEFNYENEAQSFHTPQALFTSLMGSTSFPVWVFQHGGQTKAAWQSFSNHPKIYSFQKVMINVSVFFENWTYRLPKTGAISSS